MKRTDKIIRISLITYLRMRKKFPPYQDESAASYFERLEEYMK